MWIPTQHPSPCDSNVPLVIGRGAPFHSVTWHSHGTIAGTCAGGRVPTGTGRPGLPLTTAGPSHSVHGTNEALKNEVQVRGVVYRVYSGTMIVTVYRYTGIQVYRVYR